MGNSISRREEDYDPCRPEEYTDDAKVPFSPDGARPFIGAHVEKVRGRSGRFKGLRCIRKNIIQDLDGVDIVEAKRQLAREARILHNARHQHVVQLFHTCFDSDMDQLKLTFSIVMERADTSLDTYLKPIAAPTKIIPLHWFGCLIAAVRHIHGLGIRHRDIKPSNILVKGGQVLLTDFGISQMGLGKTMPTTNLARNAARSKDYCAPEVDQGRTRGRSADIFSLGAVFLEMCLAKSRPQDLQELAKLLETDQNRSYSRNIYHVYDWMKHKAADFQQGTWQVSVLRLSITMLHPDRYQRPSADSLQLMEQLSCRCVDKRPVSKNEELLSGCRAGTASTVQGLLLGGADPNTMGALHLAAEHGLLGVVQDLLRAGAAVDSLNATGQTALHAAARNGVEDVVTLLLETGASVNAKDENQQVALHGAAAHGHVPVVRVLLQAGADVDAEDLDGNTPLQFAGRRGETVVVDLLKNWRN